MESRSVPAKLASRASAPVDPAVSGRGKTETLSGIPCGSASKTGRGRRKMAGCGLNFNPSGEGGKVVEAGNGQNRNARISGGSTSGE